MVKQKVLLDAPPPNSLLLCPVSYYYYLDILIGLKVAATTTNSRVHTTQSTEHWNKVISPGCVCVETSCGLYKKKKKFAQKKTFSVTNKLLIFCDTHTFRSPHQQAIHFFFVMLIIIILYSSMFLYVPLRGYSFWRQIAHCSCFVSNRC